MKSDIQKDLLGLMRAPSYTPLTLPQIAAALGLPRKSAPKLRKAMDSLLADGRVVAAGAPGEVLTPERIAPIYHLHVERIDHRGRPCLLFDPADTTTGTTDGRSADDTG